MRSLTGGLGDVARRGAPLGDEVDLARDRVLIVRAQGGDREGFDELYLRYYRRLYRLCLRRLSDTHEAEDVAQESFVRAWRGLPQFCGERRFYPWLSVIAANLCTDVRRKRIRATPVPEFFAADTSASGTPPDEGVIGAVDAELVRRALSRLSERHQRVLRLREHEGLSYQAIADEEGVALSAVETLLWRARQALKREYSAAAEHRPAALVALSGLGALLRSLVRPARRVGSWLGHVSVPGTLATAGSAAAGTAVVVAATTGHLGPSSPAHVTASVVGSHPYGPVRDVASRSAAPSSAPSTPMPASSVVGGTRSGGPAVSGASGTTRSAWLAGNSSSGGRTGGPGATTGGTPPSGTVVSAAGGAGPNSGGLTTGVGAPVTPGAGGSPGTITQAAGGIAGGVSNTVTGALGGSAPNPGGTTGGVTPTLPGVAVPSPGPVGASPVPVGVSTLPVGVGAVPVTAGTAPLSGATQTVGQALGNIASATGASSPPLPAASPVAPSLPAPSPAVGVVPALRLCP